MRKAYDSLITRELGREEPVSALSSRVGIAYIVYM
jgi:hypothetical protein